MKSSAIVVMVNGSLLKRKIVEKGFTTRQFAEKCGLSPFTVWRSIKESHAPTMDTLVTYARILDVPISDLLREDAFEKEAA